MTAKPSPTDLPPLQDAGEAVLRAELARIEARQAEGSIGFDKDMAMAIASLHRAIVASEGERRAKAKAKAKVIADIPLDEIMARLKSLPMHERQQLADVLTGADDDKPLL